MRKSLLLTFLSSILISSVYGQKDRFAYVVTDVSKEGINWSTLRKIDLQNNSFSDILLNGNDQKQLAFDAASKKQMTAPLTDPRYGTVANAAFGTGVAAIAFDKKNNRLYYTPMFIDQLRYIDLKTMNVYFVSGSENAALKVKASDQSNIITRMAFASDGYGYALTNDGTHLLQFTTGKKINVTDLGSLVDAPSNNGISVHNSCSSFGGDMIADDDGNLYVFSARNHVFKVDIETKVATHLGVVNGLPAGFTINGAAVNEYNQILVVSATNNSGIYTLDSKTWNATLSDAGVPWRSSDLANSNLLQTRQVIKPAELMSSINETPNKKIQLYPNPVLDNKFTVQFNQPEGNYTILVTDVLGRQTIKSVTSINGKGQTESIQLPASTKKGVYLVKVVDQQSQTIFSKKILVQ
jgi:hypothetical protein